MSKIAEKVEKSTKEGRSVIKSNIKNIEEEEQKQPIANNAVG
mgnify:FL=1